MLKKILAMALALAMVLCLFACDSNSTPDKGNPDSETTEATGSGNSKPDDEKPGDDQPGNDQPGDDQPGNDQPGNDQPGNDQPGNDQPGNDQPGNDQPGNDQPGNDHPGDDHPSDPSPVIYGSWSFEVKPPKGSMGEGIDTTGMSLTMIYTFNADGTVTMSANAASVDTLCNQLKDDMVKQMMDELEAKGVTEKDFIKQYDMTVAEFVANQLEETKKALVKGEKSDYSIVNDTLTIDGTDYAYKLTATELQLTSDDLDTISDHVEMGAPLPLVMSRIG